MNEGCFNLGIVTAREVKRNDDRNGHIDAQDYSWLLDILLNSCKLRGVPRPSNPTETEEILQQAQNDKKIK